MTIKSEKLRILFRLQNYKYFMKKELIICYSEFDTLADLAPHEQALMQSAMDATSSSYSPYSHFSVGAAVCLSDGTIVQGSNQENVAYPSGLCAERTALFAAAAHHRGCAMEAIAVVARHADGQWVEASPCGACRQVMAEYQSRQGSNLKVLLYRNGGKVWCFDSVDALLPFVFNASL